MRVQSVQAGSSDHKTALREWKFSYFDGIGRGGSHEWNGNRRIAISMAMRNALLLLLLRHTIPTELTAFERPLDRWEAF